MPLTNEPMIKLKAADELLANIITQDVADAVNRKVKNGEKADIGMVYAYKAHTPAQLAALYTPEMMELQNKAKKILLFHIAMADAKYLDDEGYEKHPLNRMANYEIDPSFAALGDDQKAKKEEIEQKNRERIKKLQDSKKAREVMNKVTGELLKTDFSPLYSGDPKRIIDFLEKNMYVCEYAKEVKLLIKAFEADADLKEEEKKNLAELKERESELNNFGGFAEGIITMVSSEYYPLLQGTGFEYHTDEVGLALTDYFVQEEDLSDDVKAFQESFNNITAGGSSMTTLLDLKNADGEDLSEKERKQANAAAEAICTGRFARQAAERISSMLGLSRAALEKKLADGGLQILAAIIPDNVKYDPKRGMEGYLTDLYKAGGKAQYIEIYRGVEGKPGYEKININLQFSEDTPKKFGLDVNTERSSSEISDQAIMRLKELQKELKDNGTTGSDSPEYTRMSSLLNSLTAELFDGENPKHYLTDGLARKMKALTKAADDYYYAKLEEPHNRKRAARFAVARELKNISEELEKGKFADRTVRERKQYRMTDLKRDLIAKYIKTEALITAGRWKDPELRQESIEMVREDLNSRKEIYKIAERIAFNKNAAKLGAWERDLKESFEHLFNKRTVEELEKMVNSKGSDIHKLVEKAKEQVVKEKMQGSLAAASTKEDDTPIVQPLLPGM